METKFLEPITRQFSEYPWDGYDYGKPFVDADGDALRGYAKISTTAKESFLNQEDFYIFKYGIMPLPIYEAFEFRSKPIAEKEVVILARIVPYFIQCNFMDKINILTEHIGFTKMPFAIKDAYGVARHFLLYNFINEPATFELFVADNKEASVARISRFHHGKNCETFIPIGGLDQLSLLHSLNYLFQQIYSDIHNLNFNIDENLMEQEVKRMEGFKFRSIGEIPIFNKRI